MASATEIKVDTDAGSCPAAPSHKITAEFSPNLNLLHITMIGAGVFLGVGNAIRVAGPGGVILTFALNAVIALFTAMSYAELSSAVPRAGGRTILPGSASDGRLLWIEKGVALLVACRINYRGASDTGTMGALFTLGQTATL